MGGRSSERALRCMLAHYGQQALLTCMPGLSCAGQLAACDRLRTCQEEGVSIGAVQVVGDVQSELRRAGSGRGERIGAAIDSGAC